jgi:1,4-dihydroxy-6-naphthoate synthase
MRRYAQEFSDDILFAHVDLYVNQWTIEMGAEGERALVAMHRVAVERELLPPNWPTLQIFDRARDTRARFC